MPIGVAMISVIRNTKLNKTIAYPNAFTFKCLKISHIGRYVYMHIKFIHE